MTEDQEAVLKALGAGPRKGKWEDNASLFYLFIYFFLFYLKKILR